MSVCSVLCIVYSLFSWNGLVFLTEMGPYCGVVAVLWCCGRIEARDEGKPSAVFCMFVVSPVYHPVLAGLGAPRYSGMRLNAL